VDFRIIDYRPPRIAGFFVLIAALLHRITPLSQLYIWSSPLQGAVIAITGFTVMMQAWWRFRKYETAICPTAKTERLVTSGIYRYTRNPMYLGLAGMLLAIAISIGTFPFYCAFAAFFMVMNSVFCPYEENRLSEAFGHAYLSYRNRVRRWL
jgi:protein-S-isoprenylcysteine O-methyltransferase Ste14